ncbi:hypothetical protein E6C60_0743 [Paenibacillus algicola]|uniref:DUF3037 domain-containing protein n=1 Tax=Paenibacillus algicola TaxID=2565926 RepID=A0A4V1G3K0_9BACL|nr:DUF3037 domain-containing protein [Paenibacillus algicola]QCT01464.1 hypothetical protein E6C60_0743 [Paenibacillus algicola]
MERVACWYSVVRYKTDVIAGEVVNVGVVLHSTQDVILTRFHVLDETSPKIKAVTNSRVEEATYKTAKDILEYYLQESTKSLSGTVGTVQISSALSDDFLNDLYKFYSDNQQNLFLSEPTFAMTENLDGLFKSIFNSYVGRRYQIDDQKDLNIKKYVRQVFEERNLINSKVASDIELTPLHDIQSVKINIDFGFKNGVWNYLQTIPTINGPSKGTEWFAKTKFMIESVKEQPKFYLMYRTSELKEGTQQYLSELIDFFSKNNDHRVIGLDLDNKQRLSQLCSTIEKDAHDLKDVLVS